jgi:hypothetical protein
MHNIDATWTLPSTNATIYMTGVEDAKQPVRVKHVLEGMLDKDITALSVADRNLLAQLAQSSPQQGESNLVRARGWLCGICQQPVAVL